MDKHSGTCIGGDEVFLLCEKVNKKDIKIRFFEVDIHGNSVWEAFGNFTEADVHHQVAIVFRTPPYKNQIIERPVQVYVQLVRPKDGEYSECRSFVYKPSERDDIERKRKKAGSIPSDVGLGYNSTFSDMFGLQSGSSCCNGVNNDQNINFYGSYNYNRSIDGRNSGEF